MPTYRFRWENIDPLLIEALCPEEDTHEDRISWLRASYGARPRADFIADVWPILRDTWVLPQPELRDGVIAQLREAGLGDMTVDVATADGCAEYLKSCRNATTLRSIVLDELIRAGEDSSITAKPVSNDWTPFEAALATALAGLAEDQFLILSIKNPGADDDAPRFVRFVQFAAQGAYGMRVEAISNEFLHDADRLEQPQIDALRADGWLAPTSGAGDTPETDPDGSPNFWRQWENPVPMHKVAHLAVTALRDVYGAPHPGFLTVEAYDTEGNAVAVPDLQFEPTPDAPAVDEGTAAPLLLRPTDPEELRRAVHASLTRLLQADEIVVDDDGDIPIRWGSAALYVRVLDDHPIVRIFSPILTDIVITPQVREAVNEVNRDRPLVSAMWIDDTVILVAEVFAATFSEDNFVNVLHALAETADELDDDFSTRFGDHTGDHTGGRVGYGGYL